MSNAESEFLAKMRARAQKVLAQPAPPEPVAEPPPAPIRAVAWPEPLIRRPENYQSIAERFNEIARDRRRERPKPPRFTYA